MIEADISVEAPGWEALAGLEDLALRAVAAAQAIEPLAPAGPAGMGLTFADDAAMQRLNAGWRGKDRPTNVLSFPAAPMPKGAPAFLGDVILGYETVAREAAEGGRSLADHTTHLIVHGVLHLLGHDHIDPVEAERMEALETAALASLGIADPYSEPPA